MQYPKPALSFEEQLTRLEGRGLVVPDRDRALRWLSNISFYRLSAYCLPFKDGEAFRAGSNFDHIAGLYIFDRRLRLIMMDAIERVEIAIRTALTYQIAHAFGPFGHAEAKNFDPTFKHTGFIEELIEEEGRSHETFVEHYRTKYTSEKYLPVWMAMELASFGQVSRLYQACNPTIKRSIARPYNVLDKHLGSWLHALNYVRNVCAHHRRLWNRDLRVRPRLPDHSKSWPYAVSSNARLYCILVILRHMLRVVSPQCMWRDRLFALFDAHPAVSLDAMGIPADWRTTPLWAAPAS